MDFNVICTAFEKKIPKTVCHTISVYGKMFIIEISYNLWNCMKLYDKKFPNYENCMTSIFGQPGFVVLLHVTKNKNLSPMSIVSTEALNGRTIIKFPDHLNS